MTNYLYQPFAEPYQGWSGLYLIAKKYKLLNTMDLKKGDYIVYWDADYGIRAGTFLGFRSCGWTGGNLCRRNCPGYMVTEYGNDVCVGFTSEHMRVLCVWKVDPKKWEDILLLESF